MVLSFKKYIKEGYREDSPSENEEELNGLHKSLTHHYHKRSKLGFFEKMAVQNYTNNSSSINSHLWENKGGSHDEPYGADLEDMDKVLHGHKTPHDLTVYSGLNAAPNISKTTKIYHHPAYLSTSLSHQTASGFANSIYGKHRDTPTSSSQTVHKHTLRIHVPKGHPGFVPGPLSVYPEEREVLLPRGLKLRIDPSKSETRRHTMKWNTTGGNKKISTTHVHHIHHAEIVGEEE